MPTYEYQCDQCHRTFEIRQRITEPPLSRCDVCGGSVKRLIAPAPFILKGGGWYVTDYPSESRKKAVESEKGGEKGSTSAEQSSTTTGKQTPTPSPSEAGSSSSAAASSD